MSESIRAVHLVSDGILVDFEDGCSCYFPAEFLSQHIGTGSNQVFLKYDPSAPGNKVPEPFTPPAVRDSAFKKL